MGQLLIRMGRHELGGMFTYLCYMPPTSIEEFH